MNHRDTKTRRKKLENDAFWFDTVPNPLRERLDPIVLRASSVSHRLVVFSSLCLCVSVVYLAHCLRADFATMRA